MNSPEELELRWLPVDERYLIEANHPTSVAGAGPWALDVIQGPFFFGTCPLFGSLV